MASQATSSFLLTKKEMFTNLRCLMLAKQAINGKKRDRMERQKRVFLLGNIIEENYFQEGTASRKKYRNYT
jgi:hypothetical protein